jgi:hypothetical protein
MGFLKKVSEKRMKDPVEGTARVISVGTPFQTTGRNTDVHVPCKVTLVVSGPGIEPQRAEVNEVFRMRQMPGGGQDVPIIIDRANPEHFVVKWDETEAQSLGAAMSAMSERGHARAAARADAATKQALSGDPDAARPFTAGPQRVVFSSRAGDTGNPFDALAPGALGGGQTADPVDRLAKLADLRDRGAITDAEFEAEKAKILGSS